MLWTSLGPGKSEQAEDRNLRMGINLTKRGLGYYRQKEKDMEQEMWLHKRNGHCFGTDTEK